MSGKLGDRIEELPPLVHGVRGDDVHWTDAWNFSLAGTRASVHLAGGTSAYEVPLERLRGDPHDPLEMFVSAFMHAVIMARMIRAGMDVGYGVPPYPTKWMDAEQRARTLAIADRELDFEEVRRRVAPEDPSRLTAIFTAEDTAQGRRYAQSVMRTPINFLLPVKPILVERIGRYDARWLDEWQREQSQDSIEGYWSGQPLAEEPLWEYLIEGAIAARDEDALALLRDFIRRYGPPVDMRGPPPT